MNPTKSILQFQNYTVNRLVYTMVQDFQYVENETFDLSPQFARTIKKMGDDEYSLTLDIKIGDESQRIPFIIDVSVEGVFSTNQVENPEKAMRINATSILFPYVRSLITMISNLASIPPIILPPFNFTEMMNNEEKCPEQTALVDSNRDKGKD